MCSSDLQTRNDVGVGIVGAPECGDVMQLQIKVSANGVIEDAKFKTFGCGSAIASSSLVTEWVKGKTIEEAAATPRGMDYIAWAANEHKRPTVRESCAKYLLTATLPVR